MTANREFRLRHRAAHLRVLDGVLRPAGDRPRNVVRLAHELVVGHAPGDHAHALSLDSLDKLSRQDVVPAEEASVLEGKQREREERETAYLAFAMPQLSVRGGR